MANITLSKQNDMIKNHQMNPFINLLEKLRAKFMVEVFLSLSMVLVQMLLNL